MQQYLFSGPEKYSMSGIQEKAKLILSFCLFWHHFDIISSSYILVSEASLWTKNKIEKKCEEKGDMAFNFYLPIQNGSVFVYEVLLLFGEKLFLQHL